MGGYGVVALAAGVVLYLAQLADFGIEALGVREVAQDPRGITDSAPSILTTRLLIAGCVILIALPIAVLGLPQPEGTLIAVYTLTLLPIAASTKWIHLGLESARPVGLARTVGELVMVVLVVGLVRESGDIGSVPLAQFAGESTLALVLLALLIRRGYHLPVRWDWSRVRSVFRRARPLVFHALLGLVIFNSDLVFLRVFRDLASVGHYAAGYTVISFLLNLGVAYGTALLPTLTRLSARTTAERSLYHVAQAHVFAAGLPIAFGGAVLAGPLMVTVFGMGYVPAAAALQILIWSIPIALFRTVAIVALIARNRHDQVLRTITSATVMNLGLNLLLIPPIGIIGAAWATVATELLRALLALRFAAQEGLPLLPVRRMVPMAVSGVVMAGILIVVRPSNLWVSVILGGISYVAVLSLMGGVRYTGGRLPTLRV